MKLKNEEQAILTRRILIGLVIGLILVVIFQVILFLNQSNNQEALQLTIEAQQSQVAALLPTETHAPSSTLSPTVIPSSRASTTSNSLYYETAYASEGFLDWHPTENIIAF